MRSAGSISGFEVGTNTTFPTLETFRFRPQALLLLPQSAVGPHVQGVSETEDFGSDAEPAVADLGPDAETA